MQRKTICQYYTLSCLFNAGGMSIISAIYVTFLIDNGLNLFEVNLVNATYFLTLFLCEIPTGAFADIFGRKMSFVISCGLMCIGMFVYGCSHTFFGFVSAEIIAAVGCTFKSGAFQAWLVDSLKHQGYTGAYTKIFARENLIRQIGGGFGAVAGSYLVIRNQALPWFVGGTVMGITTIIAYLTMKEEYFVKGIFSWRQGLISMRNIAVSSMRYGTQHKAVRFILIITCIQIFAVQALNMYWQPFFKNHGVSENHFGFLFVGMMTSVALGAFLISQINTGGKEKHAILKIQIIVGILVLVTANVSGLPLAIAFFMLHEAGRGCWSPMIDSYLQERIPSDERATIASFCAIAPHIGGAVGLVVSGGIAQLFGINVAWSVSGIVFVVGALLVARNGNNGSKQNHSSLY